MHTGCATNLVSNEVLFVCKAVTLLSFKLNISHQKMVHIARLFNLFHHKLTRNDSFHLILLSSFYFLKSSLIILFYFLNSSLDWRWFMLKPESTTFLKTKKMRARSCFSSSVTAHNSGCYCS
jgi:hypothetical protein